MPLWPIGHFLYAPGAQYICPSYLPTRHLACIHLGFIMPFIEHYKVFIGPSMIKTLFVPCFHLGNG